jgi:hypothetical protein
LGDVRWIPVFSFDRLRMSGNDGGDKENPPFSKWETGRVWFDPPTLKL